MEPILVKESSETQRIVPVYSVGRQSICQSPWLSTLYAWMSRKSLWMMAMGFSLLCWVALTLCQNSRMACFIHSERTIRDSVAAFRGREHSQEKKKKGNDNRKLLKLVSSLGSSRTWGMMGKDRRDSKIWWVYWYPSSACDLNLYIYSVVLVCDDNLLFVVTD